MSIRLGEEVGGKRGSAGALGVVPKRFYRDRGRMWPCEGRRHEEEEKMQADLVFGWFPFLTSCVSMSQNQKPLNAAARRLPHCP